MTSTPHIAGSPEGKKQGEWIAGKFKEFGFDQVEMKKYKVLLSYPTEPGEVKVLDDKGDEDFSFKSVEKAYNKYENDSRALPPFIAYSQSGTFEVSVRCSLIIFINERGSIVVRAHASHAEGLRFEPDSMP